jgi:hypothetical protein
MPRQFNTAGPCKADLHYMIATEHRLPGLRGVIDAQNYFVLHAPRPVDKTTSLLAIGQALTEEVRYAAIMVSMEMGAPFEQDVGATEHAILSAWSHRARHWLPPELQPPPWPATEPGSRICSALEA